MEEMNKKEALLNTFEGQIFQSTIDYVVAMGLEANQFQILEKEKTISPSSVKEDAKKLNIEEISLISDTPIETLVENSSFGLELLFLGEIPSDTSEDNSNDLLSKMISALNLPSGAISKCLIDREDESALDVLNKAIASNSPKAIVTLGAFATNLLLDKKTKLSKVHGQEQKYNYNGKIYSFFPVFHPDYLNINPNMKRTAWNDLKLVLEFLSK